MDKISKIIRNLEYQKLNFKSIYNLYLENIQSEVATTQIFNNYVSKHEKIVILCENYEKFLKEIFYVDINNLNSYNYILIEKSYLQDINFYEEKDHLNLKLRHQYTLDGMKIQLVTNLKKDTLNNASALIIAKDIDLFDKKIINQSEIKVINVTDNENLKFELINYKAMYCEKKFIDRTFEQNPKKVDVLNIHDYYSDNLKIIISIDYIKKFTAADSFEYLGLINKMEQDYKKEFLKNANKILKNILDNNFSSNYYKVDILLREYDKFTKDLVKEEKNFISELKKIPNNISESEKYLKVGNSRISNFDHITSQCLDNFNSKILRFEGVKNDKIRN